MSSADSDLLWHCMLFPHCFAITDRTKKKQPSLCSPFYFFTLIPFTKKKTGFIFDFSFFLPLYLVHSTFYLLPSTFHLYLYLYLELYIYLNLNLYLLPSSFNLFTNFYPFYLFYTFYLFLNPFYPFYPCYPFYPSHPSYPFFYRPSCLNFFEFVCSCFFFLYVFPYLFTFVLFYFFTLFLFYLLPLPPPQPPCRPLL